MKGGGHKTKSTIEKMYKKYKKLEAKNYDDKKSSQIKKSCFIAVK